MFRKNLIIMSILMLFVASVFVQVDKAYSSEQFPTTKIVLYVGFSAGGGTDAIGRKIAMNMEKYLGKPVVVVNKPGAGGLVSWKALAASKPDGYTLAVLVVNNALIQKHFNKAVSWVDPLKDLSLIGIVNTDDWGIAVKADAPYDTLPEFVEYLKKNPNAKVSDGGPASAYHWGWEGFMDIAGVQLKTVAYKGTARGLKALAGGEITASASGAPEADSLARAGLVKMLGISAEKRHPVFPKIPTFKEQGIDMVYGISRGIVAPANIPKEVMDTLGKAVKTAYDSEDFQNFLKTTGYGGFYLGPKEGKEFLMKEDQRYRGLMEKAGVLRK